MTLILHLSDLHLAAASASQAIGDYKGGLVAPGDYLTIQQTLGLTLERVRERLIKSKRVLDAIVVTGDIADKGSKEGFDTFLDLLKVLDEVAPAKDRIVVVPGNHDVRAGLRPGDSQ